ncbi:hypothetical protein CL628_01115 [bacterium]|nr:hypothetical protein [bacterium]
MSEKVPKERIEGVGGPEDIPSAYLRLVEKIQADPNSTEVWQGATALARQEDGQDSTSEDYYSTVPLEELIAVGESLKVAKDRNKYALPEDASREEYEILAEKSSGGVYWYDIILGHVNDKMFEPVQNRLASMVEASSDRKIEAGLDLGSGFGNTLRSVSPYFNKVTGVEQLSDLVDIVKNDPATPSNVEMHCSSVSYTELPPESFDVAVSNGLTRYLPLHKMDSYAAEVGRVLKDGGTYLEASLVKDPSEPLPKVEEEYLTSAKALLVYLIDNIISNVDAEHRRPDTGEPWDLSEMIGAFHRRGLFLRHTVDSESENKLNIETKGVRVLEFIKSDKRKANIAKGGVSRAGS